MTYGKTRVWCRTPAVCCGATAVLYGAAQVWRAPMEVWRIGGMAVLAVCDIVVAVFKSW